MTTQDDRFAHPERFRYCGEEVVHLWLHEDGTTVTVTYRFKGRVSAAVADGYSNHYLTYTPPDPWEGVALPEVEIGSGAIVVRSKLALDCCLPFYSRKDNCSPAYTLPPRRFRLTPVDAKEGER